MIVMIEQGSDRLIFDNVTHIEEKRKPSVFNEVRTIVNLYSGEKMLMGGDDIDLVSTKLTVLPNPEKE